MRPHEDDEDEDPPVVPDFGDEHERDGECGGDGKSGWEKDESFEMRDVMTQSTHLGTFDHDGECDDDSFSNIRDATWSDVARACLVHTPREWLSILLGTCALGLFLYFFLLGLELLGASARILGGCTAAALLGDETNPVGALMIGILATALLQSSSTTTSVVVGLVGGGAISVRQAIYVVMGANIGTTITNTVVAMGLMGRNGNELERAFAGASIHDVFNYLSVLILLPLEVATGFLYRLTAAMLPEDAFGRSREWAGPVMRIVAPLGNLIIRADEKLIEAVAHGEGTCDDARYYPVRCRDGIKDYLRCRPCGEDEATEECDPKLQGWGLIGCSPDTGICPAFFTNGAEQEDDAASAAVCLFLSFFLLVVCLIFLITLLQRMLLGVSTRIIWRATNVNGYVAMAIGCGVTVLVQSSSVTTSTLTPLVGMGILTLEQMFPLTLGANVGTTCTALMAATVSDRIESLQTALAHLFFNLTGILIFYPLPLLRRIPLNAARRLGKAAGVWRGFPILYLLAAFFLLPLLLLGLSACFERGTKGFVVLGTCLCLILGTGLVWSAYWWRFQDGRRKCFDCVRERQRRTDALRTLVEDMARLRSEVESLQEHTGLLPEEDEEDEGDGVATGA